MWKDWVAFYKATQSCDATFAPPYEIERAACAQRLSADPSAFWLSFKKNMNTELEGVFFLK